MEIAGYICPAGVLLIGIVTLHHPPSQGVRINEDGDDLRIEDQREPIYNTNTADDSDVCRGWPLSSPLFHRKSLDRSAADAARWNHLCRLRPAALLLDGR